MAQPTTWNGSAQRIACGQCSVTASRIQPAASELMWVICAQRSGPSRVKKAAKAALSAPGVARADRRDDGVLLLIELDTLDDCFPQTEQRQ